MTHINPSPVHWMIFTLTVGYLGAIWSLMLYLKKRHIDVWQSFGGEGFLDTTGPVDSTRFVRTGVYALFQSKYRLLGDSNVDLYVFAIRALLVLILALIAVGKASGLI